MEPVTVPAFSIKSSRHPKELYRVALASMWIWFSYYGIKALLIAYMVTQMHLPERNGYAVLGTYSALVYGLQIFGGFIADRLLGFRKSIIWGGLLMIFGHIILALPFHQPFFAGLSFIAWGSGFFSGPDAAIVGTFYPKENQTLKDSGFIIFYMITNLGMALGGLVCGYVGQKINWHYGFGLAGFFMVLGLINFVTGINKNIGAPPDNTRLRKKIAPGINREALIYIITFVAVALTLVLFYHTGIMDVVMLPLVILSFLYIIVIALRSDKAAKFKLFALLFVFVVYTFWLALYEQSTGSLNLFILRNVDMQAGGVQLPALAINNSLPSFFLVLLTPVALQAWKTFRGWNKEVHTIMKLIIGIIAMGIYFFILWFACNQHRDSGVISILWLIAGYVFMEISEVCIGPTLSSATFNLSPIFLIGTIMGIAAISGALGEYLAGKIGALSSVPNGLTDPVKTLPYYSATFGYLALLSIVLAAVFLVLFPMLKRWMQEVK